ERAGGADGAVLRRGLVGRQGGCGTGIVLRGAAGCRLGVAADRVGGRGRDVDGRGGDGGAAGDGRPRGALEGGVGEGAALGRGAAGGAVGGGRDRRGVGRGELEVTARRHGGRVREGGDGRAGVVGQGDGDVDAEGVAGGLGLGLRGGRVG